MPSIAISATLSRLQPPRNSCSAAAATILITNVFCAAVKTLLCWLSLLNGSRLRLPPSSILCCSSTTDASSKWPLRTAVRSPPELPWPTSERAYLRAVERLADAVEQRDRDRNNRDHDNKNGERRAVPLGIHLEGPFISHARRGVHPPQDLLAPTLPLFEKLWQAAHGRIRMMTIAPELEGAMEVIAEAARRGVCVSLGHSDADFAVTERAIDAGARHATHTFNAMRPLDHRNPGILGAVLTDQRVSADIIADTVHIDPAIIKLFAMAKGPEQTVLITDAISATGMPNGRYHLGSFEVDVCDGKCTINGRLAGSVLTLDRAVRNLARFAEWDMALAIGAATRNPARVAKIANKGILASGADADFIVLDPNGQVLRTFI